MFPRLLIVLGGSAVLLASCSKKSEAPPLVGQVVATAGASQGLYHQAKAADDAGNRDKAIKLYAKAADSSPTAPHSDEARFREAQLLEQKGDLIKAFDAYQKFVTQYQGSALYPKGLAGQAALAEAAARGSIKTSFLGMKSGISLERVITMQEKVRDNAPMSANAARAQFLIGQLYQTKKKDKAKQAIEAYRRVVRDHPDRAEAPEAQFMIGKVYLEQAQSGNQNQATIELARQALQDYLSQYPGHRRAGEARALMSELGGRSLQRTFDIAEFYLKTKEYESAKVYYRDVLRRDGSGPLHQKAKARLAELGEH